MTQIYYLHGSSHCNNRLITALQLIPDSSVKVVCSNERIITASFPSSIDILSVLPNSTELLSNSTAQVIVVCDGLETFESLHSMNIEFGNFVR